MQPIQQKILDFLFQTGDFPLKFRDLGRHIGVEHPQLVKHHLLKLERQGLISIDEKRNLISLNANSSSAFEMYNGTLISVPVLGSANCGNATLFAHGQVESYLKISPGIIKGKSPKEIFALIAQGNSMNNADVYGQSIEDGDYVLVDGSKKDPQSGDVVVSVIDDCANIKRYLDSGNDDYVTLLSDSKQNYSPIFIHEGDSYNVAGKVFKVLKVSN